jgi:hypothetical protein
LSTSIRKYLKKCAKITMKGKENAEKIPSPPSRLAGELHQISDQAF